jgi:hypothetical protein
MFDPVAAVAAAVGLPCRLIAVDGGADRAIADGMDGDLQAPPVDLGRDPVEAGAGEQGFAAHARMAGIVVQHIGGAAVDHAVHEHLHEARCQPVVIEGAGHMVGAVKLG